MSDRGRLGLRRAAAPATTGAKPAPAEYVVVRCWPGVWNGQRLVGMHPDRAKRLLLGGFIKPAGQAA